jgi:hypothetical protein
MTDAILLTGKRGTGKSLSAVKMVRNYLNEGRIVATNLNLNLDRLLPPWSKAVAYRLPDFPTAEDLAALPMGNPNPTIEEKNGLLLLDECGSFLNSRSWQGKDRMDVIAWLSQSRKDGWDLLLGAQHARMLDAQIRDALCDIHGICKRTDKIAIPFVSWFMRTYFNKKVMMPKFHVAIFYYGFYQGAPRSYFDIFKGETLYGGYDTTQKINAISGNQYLFTYLSAWHLCGRYMTRLEMYGRIALVMLLFGAIAGGFAGFIGGRYIKSSVIAAVPAAPPADESVFVTGVMNNGGSAITLILSDGRIAKTMNYRSDLQGSAYQVDGHWYKEKK